MPFYFLQSKQLDSITCCKIFTKRPRGLLLSSMHEGRKWGWGSMQTSTALTRSFQLVMVQPQMSRLGRAGGRTERGDLRRCKRQTDKACLKNLGMPNAPCIGSWNSRKL
jgi:hypothetical protein